jgi:hypothetical protein
VSPGARKLLLLALIAIASVGGRLLVTGAARSEEPAGLRFSPGVTAPEQAWIQAAIAGARPEAQTLIAAVPGSIDFAAMPTNGVAIGMTRMDTGRAGATVLLDVGSLDGERAIDRPTVVLHELGHVVDRALLDDALRARLDAGIPSGGRCGPDGWVPTGGCAVEAERFADTFAKWALRGAVSAAGSGYAIPAPASLEDWGAPLGLLAAEHAAGG